MRPAYENSKEDIEVYRRNSRHESPHLHRAMEMILITDGTLELGIGTDYFHMEKGDFAVIFPEMIHHYQVFGTGVNKGIYILASPALSENYMQTLLQFCPMDPVIRRRDVHPDIMYAINAISRGEKGEEARTLNQCFVRIILARTLDRYQLTEKASLGSEDLVYQTVRYIAAHYSEHVSLTGMAQDLGYSPYALSRIFQATFHMNFNRYLNEQRLEYALQELLYTDHSILDIAQNAGFESQRTFNRAFKELYHLSPREYRLQNQPAVSGS